MLTRSRSLSSVVLMCALVLAAMFTGSVAHAQGERAMTFVEHVIEADSTYGAAWIYPVDLDEDGDLDVLGTIMEADDVAWWENDGAQSFTKHIIRDDFTDATFVHAADLDSDGDLDVLATSFTLGDILWWENDGNESFAQHTIDGSFSGAQQVAAGDFDGDHDMDVVAAALWDDCIAWWENDGNEHFSKHTLKCHYDDAYSVHTVDLDDDGDTDILSTAQREDVVTWWQNDGLGGFTEHTLSDQVNGSKFVMAADLDLDGDQDVLASAYVSDSVEWLENDGSESFTQHTIAGGIDGAFGVDTADVDGDGDVDVLAAARIGGAIFWLENQGGGVFVRRPVARDVVSPNPVFAADVDEDGSTDALAGMHYDPDPIAWWEQVAVGALPDFAVIGLEITQAVQDMGNSVPLVAGKTTYVRFHVKNVGGPTSQSVAAELHGLDSAGDPLPDSPLTPKNEKGQILVIPDPSRYKPDPSDYKLNDGFYFELPSAWRAGTVTLTAIVNPPGDSQVPETDYSNNERAVALTFEPVPPLYVRLVNVRYGKGDTWFKADSIHFKRIVSWLGRAYPISVLGWTYGEIEFRMSPWEDVKPPSPSRVNLRLATERAIDRLLGAASEHTIYYGVVYDPAENMGGRALPLSMVACGPANDSNGYDWDDDGSMADWTAGHEIGHVLDRNWLILGRPHTRGTQPPPCGPCTLPECTGTCGCEPGYTVDQYPDGNISPTQGPWEATTVCGFDVLSGTVSIYPPDWKDVMTYCDDEWISKATYESIMDYVVANMGATARRSLAVGDYVMVSGEVHGTQGTAQLDTLYVITDTSGLEPPIPGDYSIRLLGAGDTMLADYPFTPHEVMDAPLDEDDICLIHEFVPFVDGTLRVAIISDTVELASVSVSDNVPQVTVQYPNGGEAISGTSATVTWTASDDDGDPLEYVVQYSDDDGLTWQVAGLGITSTTAYTLDLTVLPGSGQARVRVMASDGVNTAWDASDASFSLEKKAPAVQIESPASGAVILPDDSLTLRGGGYDVEDGTLGDSTLSWESSIDGVLGTGGTLTVSSWAPGEHTITLTGTDSDAMTGTESITLTVLVDSDGDGMPDYWESLYGLDVGTDDRLWDLDREGLRNQDEYLVGTRPDHDDSDGDTYSDGSEVALGSNPLDPDSKPPNFDPSLGAVTPSSGTGHIGLTSAFTTTWNDVNGWRNLKRCYFHIGASPSISGSVTLMYNNWKNKLWLRSDDGNTWTGGFAPGSANVLENGQAIVHCEQTTAEGAGDTLSVTWAIQFKPGYTGTKKLGMRCYDMQKARAKGEWKGTWTIE